MKPALNILIVEDSVPLRTRLLRLLLQALPGSHIGEAGDAPGALALAAQARWDAVILDISLPGESGLYVLDRLQFLMPGLPVVMCSTHNHPAVIRDCLRRGARGFVAKHEVLELLVPTLRSALAGTTERSEQATVNAPAWPLSAQPHATTSQRLAATAAQDELSLAEQLAALRRRVAATHVRAVQACQRAKAMCAAVEHNRAARALSAPPTTN